MRFYELSSTSLAAWREKYRAAMGCQIVHDSLHQRAGWTHSRALEIDEREVGYFSIAIGGPWENEPTLFESFWHELPADRIDAAIVNDLVRLSGASFVLAQSNDHWMTEILKIATNNRESQSILFADGVGEHGDQRPPCSACSEERATFRRRTDSDVAALTDAGLDAGAEWVLGLGGSLIAAGGVLAHYNPPYGDVYMAVAEPYRRRGHGTYLVQRLIETARQCGLVPAARCRPDNDASIHTLLRAGFVQSGEIVRGVVATG